MKEQPELFDKIYKFMLPGDFIAFKLTDEISTTKNGLSEGIFWDYKLNNIADWLLDYFGFNSDLVPNIVENFSPQGYITKKLLPRPAYLKVYQ